MGSLHIYSIYIVYIYIYIVYIYIYTVYIYYIYNVTYRSLKRVQPGALGPFWIRAVLLRLKHP